MKVSSFAIIAMVLVASAQPAVSEAKAEKPISSIRIHPVFAEDFACQNHWEGQLKYPGDALGTDCFVTELVEDEEGRAFSRSFTGDGLRNEDWFSWEKDVLAPFDGKVIKININPVTNDPGKLGSPPASFLVFERADGAKTLLAHVKDVTVEEGDIVEAGQAVAKVGNNGYGRNPHIHIGAFSASGEPLQIEIDLRAQGKLNSPSE